MIGDGLTLLITKRLLRDNRRAAAQKPVVMAIIGHADAQVVSDPFNDSCPALDSSGVISTVDQVGESRPDGLRRVAPELPNHDLSI